MENYIVINGKKGELTEEQLKALGIEPERKSIFRPKFGEDYYFLSADGTVRRSQWTNDAIFDDPRVLVGNCCTDKEVIRQRAYAETLNRLLWRYSMEHGGDQIDWNTAENSKFLLWFSHDNQVWQVGSWHTCEMLGCPFFASRESAESAITDVVLPFLKEHPDFKLKSKRGGW